MTWKRTEASAVADMVESTVHETLRVPVAPFELKLVVPDHWTQVGFGRLVHPVPEVMGETVPAP